MMRGFCQAFQAPCLAPVQLGYYMGDCMDGVRGYTVPLCEKDRDETASVGVGRLAGFVRSAEDFPWLASCSMAMGLCQALMYIPFLLGPAGKGLGSLLWWDPSITAAFFLMLALTMSVDGMAAKRHIAGVSSVCSLAPPRWPHSRSVSSSLCCRGFPPMPPCDLRLPASGRLRVGLPRRAPS